MLEHFKMAWIVLTKIILIPEIVIIAICIGVLMFILGILLNKDKEEV